MMVLVFIVNLLIIVFNVYLILFAESKVGIYECICVCVCV